jgi:hypothetical protein
MKIKFKPSGKRNCDELLWHKAYDENNQPIMEQGTHLAYHAIDDEHALFKHNQYISIKDLIINKEFMSELIEVANLSSKKRRFWLCVYETYEDRLSEDVIMALLDYCKENQLIKY